MKVKKFFENLRLNVKFTILIVIMILIPITILAGFLFHNMEKNVIHENVNYMQYIMERNHDQILTNIDSINMSTQFFLSDEKMLQVLNDAAEKKMLTAEELLDFQHEDIESLERLVNNNPLLYRVSVYASNDNVQEMMPILYNKSRMQRLQWAEKKNYDGWNFNYIDNIFSSFTMNQNRKIISLVTPVEDYNNGRIGTIESAMLMSAMFPSMYESIENEWSCFTDKKGNIYFGTNEKKDSKELVKKLLKKIEKSTAKDKIKTYYIKLNGQDLVVSYLSMKEIPGTLISTQDISKDLSHVRKQKYNFVFGMIILIIAAAFGINWIVNRLLRQFYSILKSIREVQKGDLNVEIKNCGSDEMGELGIQINKMLIRIKKLMEDNIKRELMAKNAEIRALQNQINAHFIYNVLESIKMMAEIEEEYTISDAITSLGKMLRYNMKWVSNNVTVEEELSYIKNYMALMNIRYDFEIYLSINMPELIKRQRIPKMSLQPIVENAIVHGIEQLCEDTNIYVKGVLEGKDCVIEITDAGKGMSEEELEKLNLKINGNMQITGESGIGLKNVSDRIKISFGEMYGIHIASKVGCYTKVMIKIPIQMEPQSFITGDEKDECTNSRR